MNVCKFCGHPHNNDAPIIRRPRPPVTQRAEDIIERRPPTYKILAYDLSKPRVNELQNFSADTISVIEAVPADLQFTIRVNHHESDEIPMKLGRSVSIPFVRFFLTTPRYTGGKLKLMIGGEVGNFKYESPDIIQEGVTDDKILAIRRRDIICGFVRESGIAGTYPSWYVSVVGEKSFLLEKIHLMGTFDWGMVVDKIWYGWGKLGDLVPKRNVPFYSMHYNREEPDFLVHYSQPTTRPFAPSYVQSKFFDSRAELQIDFSVPVIIEKDMKWTFGLFCEPPPGWHNVGFHVTFWGYKIPRSGIASPPEPPPPPP